MSHLIRVNGQQEELTAATVLELLRAKGIDPSGRFVAVAVNGAVVPRRDWMTARVGADDNIEIVRPMSGG
ncbi:MAG: sulfur carrier protein ThiS [Dongiaceae bacterium]